MKEVTHDKYNSNFSAHSHLTQKKQMWEAVQLDLLSLNGTKVAEWNIYFNPKQAGEAESAHRLVLPAAVLKW